VVQGDKLDMNSLYATFAMKSKPDDTINRIVELEKQAKEMTKRQDKTETDTNQRLDHLENKVDKDHEDRIKILEDAVKALQDGMGTGTGSGDLDTA